MAGDYHKPRGTQTKIHEYEKEISREEGAGQGMERSERIGVRAIRMKYTHEQIVKEQMQSPQNMKK